MTVERWLSERRPAPPARLGERMFSALRGSGQIASTDVVAGTRVAALDLLRSILRGNDVSRAGALDLLASDALMSYSCEAACESPETLLPAAQASIAAVHAEYRAAVNSQIGTV